MHKSLFVAVLIGFVEIASGQSATSPVGNWVGTMGPGPGGLFLKTQMSIADGGNTGTWRMTAPVGKGMSNPCFNRDMPVVVKLSSETELELEVHGDGVLHGCLETKGVMKYDGKTIEGNFQNGSGVKLSRP